MLYELGESQNLLIMTRGICFSSQLKLLSSFVLGTMLSVNNHQDEELKVFANRKIE